MNAVAVPAVHLERLLAQINGGSAAAALSEIEQFLREQPDQPAMLALRAEALRMAGRAAEAVHAYQQAGRVGGGARNWLVAGVMLAGDRRTDEALQCLRQALAQAPDDEQTLDSLITTLFNANRHREAIEYARRQLAIGSNPRFLSNAALLLQNCDCYEEASAAFKRILQLAPDDPALIGAALAAARFTCEWDWIESLQRQIGAYYARGDYASPQEYPLTHLTWCRNEALNLEVTRAYAQRTRTAACTVPSGPRPPGPRERIRVGYLSCDFRNHATMHLMAGLLESHDRRRFEIFAYDYSAHDISSYRQRFLNSVEHHVEIHSLSDSQAAARIAQDQLDILFDLKVYTGGCRPGILAYRPAPLQVAYLGFPGSAASEDIDFIVSDRFVTPDASSAFYTETFCRLPHSYQCNDHQRAAAAEPGTRSLHGLPDGRVVFAAFNQTYKIDRASFGVWLRVLHAVPDSVLWLLGQNAAAITHLSAEAASAGIASDRLVFAPFAAPHEHLARLQLADAVLDTLICNGHTTTSDALWAGVPVVTARGSHFASRVSESLLNAMQLPELVGADPDEMIAIAARIGTDAGYRGRLREQLLERRRSAPLFDTPRFARDFELAIECMVTQQRSGLPPSVIDVPDLGPLPATARTAASESSLLAPYQACPLCSGRSVTLGFAQRASQAGPFASLGAVKEWLRCAACGHVHTRQYLTDAGRAQIAEYRERGALSLAALQTGRADCTGTVERALRWLGGVAGVSRPDARALWVDVECGDGALLLSAADYGFAAVGLGASAASAEALQALGIEVLRQPFLPLRFEVVVDVLSLVGVLERLPFPQEALRKAAQVLRPGGVLLVQTPDLSSSGWRLLEATRSNPYWSDPVRCHLFSRERLLALLRGPDFEIVDLAVPAQPAAQLQIYARRR